VRDEDLEPFAALNADPAVMEYLPGMLSRDESDAMAGRIHAHFAEHGFGLWAVEGKAPEPASFIGFVGLWRPTWTAQLHAVRGAGLTAGASLLPLARGDGAAGGAARSGRRPRPPADPRRTPAATARAVPPQPMKLDLG
jgi:RimJ/RimL family protein N-acetyltransferase